MRTYKFVALWSLCAASLLAMGATRALAQEVAAGAPITAADINALRADAESLAPGCSSVFRWTDDPIVPGQTPVKAHHFIELRRAINNMVRGQCPTLHEQVTVAGVRLVDGSSGYHSVQGSVLNSGSIRIAGSGLYVRVRFFDANNAQIVESRNYLRDDRGFALTSLDPQQQRLFSVRLRDSDIQDWRYFQTFSFEVDNRRVLCVGCAQRHARQREQVTVEDVHLRNGDRGYRYVEGSVQNTGLTRIAGSTLTVRVHFLDDNDQIVAEETNYLRDDRGFALTSLDPQQRHLFIVGFRDSAIQNWSYLQVATFEDDRRLISCAGCGEPYNRQLEQVTFGDVHFTDTVGRYSHVGGYVLNSGVTDIVGSSLVVRVQFFQGNLLRALATNYLRNDRGFALTSLDAQQRHLFSVGIEKNDLERGWDNFRVSFEDDGTPLDCIGCDQQYRPR